MLGLYTLSRALAGNVPPPYSGEKPVGVFVSYVLQL